MRPIVKWPGGKSRELARIRALVPSHELLVEPFVGGGALFFDLEPAAALLNDASEDLVAFYRAARDDDARVRSVLDAFDRDRERLRERAAGEAPDFAALLVRTRFGTDRLLDEPRVRAAAATALEIPAAGPIARSVVDKARRLVGLERKHGKVFGVEEVGPHYETALQAGYYTAIRDGFPPEDAAGGTARFLFLREFCYGSMFR